jgi:hypothetical protein
MKNRFLSVALLFLAIAASNGEGERATLQQKIAQLQTQLGPLKQTKDDAAAAVLKIKFVNGSYVLDGKPADMAAAVAKYSAATEQYTPIEKQLLEAQAALRVLETPNPNLATQKAPLQHKAAPPPGSDDPDRLLGGDDAGTQNPPPRHNPAPPPPGSDDSDLGGVDLDLDSSSGHSPSSHGPSGHTTSTGHPGDSQHYSAPEHSHSGQSGSGHPGSGHGAEDSSGHSGSGHSGSGHSESGHSGSEHSGQSGSGHSGTPDPH